MAKVLDTPSASVDVPVVLETSAPHTQRGQIRALLESLVNTVVDEHLRSEYADAQNFTVVGEYGLMDTRASIEGQKALIASGIVYDCYVLLRKLDEEEAARLLNPDGQLPDEVLRTDKRGTYHPWVDAFRTLWEQHDMHAYVVEQLQ